MKAERMRVEKRRLEAIKKTRKEEMFPRVEVKYGRFKVDPILEQELRDAEAAQKGRAAIEEE